MFTGAFNFEKPMAIYSPGKHFPSAGHRRRGHRRHLSAPGPGALDVWSDVETSIFRGVAFLINWRRFQKHPRRFEKLGKEAGANEATVLSDSFKLSQPKRMPILFSHGNPLGI